MNETDKRALELHKKLRGKIEVVAKDSLDSKEKLSLYYTPGVGAVSREVAEKPELSAVYTGRGNSVAVISDGSAVLGLGNIGPLGAMPVMEGKAMIFKSFAGIDAYPIVLNTQDPKEIIATVKAIAPTYGGINLEDIKAPECFEVERRLKEELDIPVFHDDQHGTAVVVLAGVINALRVVERSIDNEKIVISGAGAAGVAIAQLLAQYGAKNIITLDSKGAITSQRQDLNSYKRELAAYNQDDISGRLGDVIEGAGIFIGVSQPSVLDLSMVQKMSTDSIVFAMSNPVPEIMPDLAQEGGAAVIATGRSDFPNQINNALVFPGVFRGALDNKVRNITTEHKINAAKAVANLVNKPTAQKIIPDLFDDRLVSAVAQCID